MGKQSEKFLTDRIELSKGAVVQIKKFVKLCPQLANVHIQIKDQIQLDDAAKSAIIKLQSSKRVKVKIEM